jgi:hypothetical protein
MSYNTAESQIIEDLRLLLESQDYEVSEGFLFDLNELTKNLK